MKEIKLTKGRVALVDDGDYAEISKYSWHFKDGYGQGYAVREKQVSSNPRRRKLIKMHRAIMGAGGEDIVDHVNFNKLDNRRGNLRVVTISLNNLHRQLRKDNKSGFAGVHKIKGAKARPYHAQLGFRGRRMHLGNYSSLEEAHNAYKEALLSFHEYKIQ